MGDPTEILDYLPPLPEKPAKKRDRPTDRCALDAAPRPTTKTATPGVGQYTLTYLHHGDLSTNTPNELARDGWFFYLAKFAESGDQEFRIIIHKADIDRIRKTQWPGSGGKAGKIKAMGVPPRPVTVLVEWRGQDQPIHVRSLRPLQAAQIAVEKARTE